MLRGHSFPPGLWCASEKMLTILLSANPALVYPAYMGVGRRSGGPGARGAFAPQALGEHVRN